MARGFESKSVAEQQEAAVAERARGGGDTPEVDPAVALKRRKLELARADVVQRLASAQAPAYRVMLERALAALDADLAQLG